MEWEELIADPPTFVVRRGGRILCEIVREDDGTWRWYRRTTFALDNTPPGGGVEPSRHHAMRRALEGLRTAAAK